MELHVANGTMLPYPPLQPLGEDSSFRQCKFDFTRVTETDWDRRVRLSEVRMYSGNGAPLDLTSGVTASSPHSSNAGEAIDGNLGGSSYGNEFYSRAGAVPATLLLDFSSAVSVSAYAFASSHCCGLDSAPTDWQHATVVTYLVAISATQATLRP